MQQTNLYRTTVEIDAGLTALGASPTDEGTVEMIVARPDNLQRTVLQNAEFDTDQGLVGDNWLTRGSKHTEDGSAIPGAQIALMNSRVIQALAPDRERWALAGDQLFVDLDLSAANLPTGQCLSVGTVILEITDVPHNGCDKFTERYGHDAIRFINSPEGRAARRRGVYARVIQPGTIAVGDVIRKITTSGQ